MGPGKLVKPRPSGAQQRKKKATDTAFTKKIAGSMLKYVVTNSITRADEGGDDSSASTTNAPAMHQQLRSYSEIDEHGDTPPLTGDEFEDEREREDPIYERGVLMIQPIWIST